MISYHLYLRYREPIISQLTDSNISPKKLPLLEEKIPTPQHLSKLVNKNKILNLNIASYFLNILASPDESTWSTTGGLIKKTIKNIGQTIHHQHKVEIMWHMVNKCK